MNSFVLSPKTIPNITTFHQAILNIVPEFLGFNVEDSQVTAEFSIEVTQALIDTVEAIVPPQESQVEIVQGIITNAMIFGQKLMVEFAAENVMMGITQAGKTKAIADYLANVIRYIQTGSLYEVINEINALELAGVPVELDPYISTARLDEFKAKVEAYLGV